jgi:hypothetical protein
MQFDELDFEEEVKVGGIFKPKELEESKEDALKKK